VRGLTSGTTTIPDTEAERKTQKAKR